MNKLTLPLQTVVVNSTAIKSCSYAHAERSLTLLYAGGGSYSYNGVPSHVFEGLRNSQSKGVFINTFILGSFSFNKLN